MWALKGRWLGGDCATGWGLQRQAAIAGLKWWGQYHSSIYSCMQDSNRLVSHTDFSEQVQPRKESNEGKEIIFPYTGFQSIDGQNSICALENAKWLNCGFNTEHRTLGSSRLKVSVPVLECYWQVQMKTKILFLNGKGTPPIRPNNSDIYHKTFLNFHKGSKIPGYQTE